MDCVQNTQGDSGMQCAVRSGEQCAVAGTYCGTYIAYHPALKSIAAECGVPGIIKIGESGRLEGRLYDSAYTTCWTDEWKYLVTFETDTREDGQRLETYLLRLNNLRKYNGREMVKTTSDPQNMVEELANMLTTAAASLNIKGKINILPTYERPCYKPDAPSSRADTVEPCEFPELPLPPVENINESDNSRAGSITPPVVNEIEIKPIAAPFAGGANGVEIDVVDEMDALEISDVNSIYETVDVPLEPREYQNKACDACVSSLEEFDKTQLVMACRCGKTRVAHMVIEQVVSKDGINPIALFIVPSLQLVRETANKIQRYGVDSNNILMVGSGSELVNKDGKQNAGHKAMTTSADLVAKYIDEFVGGDPRDSFVVVVSTYHSSFVAMEGVCGSSCGGYGITVFDECHRTCGNKKRRFANEVVLYRDMAATGKRLFMTATPVTDGAGLNMKDYSVFGGIAYSYHLRQGIDAGYVNDFEIQLVASSRDAFSNIKQISDKQDTSQSKSLLAKFIAFIRKMVGSDKLSTAVKDAVNGVKSSDLEEYCEDKIRAAQIAIAYMHLTDRDCGDTNYAPRNKLLVFCRTIKDAERLMDETKTLFGMVGDMWKNVSMFSVHSRMHPTEVADRIRRMQDPENAAIVFNCKMFQEGVEFMPLNGVFFATPRHSSRDIIQSLCRSLTKGSWTSPDGVVMEKPRSAIYIPVEPSAISIENGSDAEDLGRFSTLLPFADALWSEDSRFYDHLLDPSKPYPLGWIGSHGSTEKLLHMARRAIRYGVKAGGCVPRRDRLTLNSNIPWDIGFGELKRTVTVCRRYPKNNDGFSFTQASVLKPGEHSALSEPTYVNFSSWFDWAKKQYVKYRNGEKSELQHYQVVDLESLPHWSTRGLKGPYDPIECLKLFEEELELTNGEMPMVSVSSAEWIGFDSTKYERMSGFFRVINQQDGHGRKFRIDCHVASELDRICKKWGLRWRKDREYSADELEAAIVEMGKTDPSLVNIGPYLSKNEKQTELNARAMRWLETHGQPGELVAKGKMYRGRPTCIQLASKKFHALAKADPNSPEVQNGWPGFPLKHKYSEHIDVMEKNLAPPRYATKKGTIPKLVERKY